jgi:RNA polymerase sigma factor for flagellar operon FliA
MELGDYQQLLGELKGLEIGTLYVKSSDDSAEEEAAIVAERPKEDPLFQCLQQEMTERIAEALTALAERERLVISLFYYEDISMKQIGEMLGLSQSRVSQIHLLAMRRIRSKLGTLPKRRTQERPRCIA